MKHERIVSIFAVIGLLAVLATTAYSATSVRAATPTLAGTWNVAIPKSEGNPQPGQAILTFDAINRQDAAGLITPAPATAA